MSLKVLITGGAGFIGYHLARYHVSLGHAVILVDNLFKAQGAGDADFQRLIDHPAVQLIRHDLTTPWVTDDAALADLDLVYHLAAINGTQLFYDIPYQVARTNVLVTVGLLDFLSSRKVGGLIYSSTSEVYAGAEQVDLLKIPTDEQVPVVFAQPTGTRFSYGTSKFMGEFLCTHFAKQFQIPCAVVRYHNIYGPRMGQRHVIPEFIERIRRKESPFDIYGGHETRAFCYVDDAVEATYRVATTPACAGETIHIGNSSQEIRIAELATLLMSLMGFHAELRERGFRNGSVSRRCPDVAKLHRLTGFTPTVDLREGLSRTLEWYLATPKSATGVPAQR
ncbi:MAG: NAD-dependent epimerase/dehydratase family protein [Candidatus Omnitrophica bacterium]|nr:NAD-dependent epimerase/dehydratase family protein [Candidatus Omnitrophota bacterium]